MKNDQSVFQLLHKASIVFFHIDQEKHFTKLKVVNNQWLFNVQEAI